MTITRFSTGAIRDNALATNTSFAASDMELIGTIRLNSNTSSITFSNIPQEYKHLQLRAIWVVSTFPSVNMSMRFNSDSGSSYAYHALSGDGASVSSSAATSQTSLVPAWGAVVGALSCFMVDVLDYSNASKFKTARILWGSERNGAGNIALRSALWMKNDSLTSINIFDGSTIYGSGSKFSLYGIRG